MLLNLIFINFYQYYQYLLRCKYLDKVNILTNLSDLFPYLIDSSEKYSNLLKIILNIFLYYFCFKFYFNYFIAISYYYEFVQFIHIFTESFLNCLFTD